MICSLLNFFFFFCLPIPYETMVETTGNLNTNLGRTEVIHPCALLFLNRNTAFSLPSHFLFFGDRVSVCCLASWPGTLYLDKAGLEKWLPRHYTVRLVIPNRQAHYWLSCTNLIAKLWYLFFNLVVFSPLCFIWLHSVPPPEMPVPGCDNRRRLLHLLWTV